ncbi:MAG: hypothetical protein JWO31_2406, partial [Phycisphaerales bacterium]|nr:hypothetical protein [Phycisphaerales bacterium]
PQGPLPPTTRPRCRVLVVDDDELCRTALTRVLGHLGHPVDAAATVGEGLAVLGGQGCAILDLNLPDGVGTTILARVRAEGRPMRVAVASGTTDAALLAEAVRLKPDLMLRKPIDVGVLAAWLDAAC